MVAWICWRDVAAIFDHDSSLVRVRVPSMYDTMTLTLPNNEIFMFAHLIFLFHFNGVFGKEFFTALKICLGIKFLLFVIYKKKTILKKKYSFKNTRL